MFGSGLKFSRIELLWKRLKLDFKTESTTNGLTLRFFVGICLVLSASFLIRLESARFAQVLVILTTSNLFDG